MANEPKKILTKESAFSKPKESLGFNVGSDPFGNPIFQKGLQN